MSKNIFIVIFLGCYLLFPTSLAFSAEFLDKIVNYFEEFFTAPPQPESISLPTIPRIVPNARSTDVYNIKPRQNAVSPKGYKFDQLFIEEIYHVTRNQTPTTDKLQTWLNVLDQGGGREGFYRAMVLDDTYRELESTNQLCNDALTKFISNYMSTYLKLRIEKKFFVQYNFFKVKRVVIEKTLEVIDELNKRENDLNNWYAVLSSELAIKFKKTWRSKIRKEVTSSRHKRWAERVPLQHIKSEVIIKLHRSFNYLETP